MNILEKIITPSAQHRVEKGESGFSIMPIDESEKAVAEFQPIAKEAMKYSGSEYSVKPHKSEGNFDLVFFQKNC